MAVTLTAVTAYLRGGQGGAGTIGRDSVTVAVTGSPAIGISTAPVTILEFTDNQCPFCARHATTVLQRIRREYVETGKVRYVLRDLPLSIHPYAPLLARAARCVAAIAPNKHLAFHDSLFAHQRGLTADTIWRVGATLGIARRELEGCARSSRFDEAVEADLQVAAQVGFSGTPSFVAGLTPAGDTMRGGSWTGAFAYEQFKAVIDSLLIRQAAAPAR